MVVQRQVHPSADVLKAFGLGKLDDSSSGFVKDHLDQCDDCRKQVAASSGDDVLNRVRPVHSLSGTPAPVKSLAEVAHAAKPPASQTPIGNLPPELVNNPNYDILRELGRGGMGVVYLAKNKLMDRLEVLKVVNKALLDRPGAVERFLREIRSAAKLNHVNVVAAHSAVQQGELLAFAMEYVEGEDLASVVKSQGPLPIAHACFYVQQAAWGLQHAFEKHMVHRDIKPQNLILAREGRKHIVKVLDFGLAKVMREKSDDTGLTGDGKMLGTPDYIAPEQTFDAAKADIRADIYSLGCTLYFLLSGRPPFSATSLGAILLAHQMQEAKPLNSVRAEVAEELAAVVRKMMAKSVDKRYQTPLEVVQALAPFVKQGASSKSAPELSVGTATAASGKAMKSETPPVPIAPAIQTPPMPQAPSAVVRQSMTEGRVTSAQPRRSAAVRQSRPPMPKSSSRRKWLIGGGIGVGVLILALLSLWRSGVFGVKTRDGILIDVAKSNAPMVENVSPKPETPKTEIAKPETPKPETPKTEIAKPETPKPETPKTEIAKPETPKPETPKTETPNPETKKPVVAAAPTDTGFVPLFNGKDRRGWSVDGGLESRWSVEGNTIVGRSTDSAARTYLLTNKDFADYVLRFDYIVEDGSNGGVAIRAIVGEKVYHQGGALLFGHPILKLTNPAMEAKQPTGTTHWLKSAEVDAPPLEVLSLPTGIWRTMEVVVRRGNCTATFAGKQFVNVTLDPDAKKKGEFVPGLQRVKGKVGFQIHTGTIRFRNIEIKELPAAKSEASAASGAAIPKSPSPRAKSDFPPEAKDAAEAFEKSSAEARAKFLADFDTVLGRLAKAKGALGQRLKLIDLVKAEKQRFEIDGLIPWSEPMRPYLAKYSVAITTAKGKLRRAYISLIEAQLKAKNESMVTDLRADLANLTRGRRVARWRHFVNGKLVRIVSLYSDGQGGRADPRATWLYENGVLNYLLPDPAVPGGFGIDKLHISADGLTYSGYYNTGRSGKKLKITGTYLMP